MKPRHLIAGLSTALLIGATAATIVPTTGFAQQAAAPAQAGPARERPLPGRHVEGRIAFMRTELKITDGQQAQWERVAATMRTNAAQMDQMATQMRGSRGQPATAVERLDRQAQFADARASSAKAFAAAFKPLYDSLSADQKKSADELFDRHMRRGGRR
jgi:hypothetical protein